MFLKSLKWRLQAWHGIILLAVLAGFGFTAHRLQRANEFRRVDQELLQRLAVVLDALRRPPPLERSATVPPPGSPEERWRPGPPDRGLTGEHPPPPRDFRLPPNRARLFEEEGSAFYYVVWVRDGRELSRSASAPDEVPRPERAAAVTAPAVRTRGVLREACQFTPPGECLLVGRSITPELARLHDLALWLAGLGATVLVFGLAGGWWLATRAIRPIAAISATASRISAGNLAERISVAGTDNELGRLTGVLNSTFARLDAAFAQQKQFTSDAAHELRTPVTVMLTQTQSALARERPAAEYRETLEACQRAAQRMRRLIESLLELARLDAGQEPMKREPFDLARAARESVELVRPLAAERGIAIHTDLAALACQGDAERVSQVITNLLSNAIHYNRDRGEVRLCARAEDGVAVLTVTDTGEGIAAEDLPHVFERFYRADKSRARANGRTGLGLAICQAIVEAHGGAIAVASERGVGAIFTVRLPLDPGAGGRASP
jgi:heavy metal sensor kinase